MERNVKTGIVVIGSVYVDIKGYPFGQYLPTGRNAGRIVTVHGGVSRNIAEDIANAGVGLHPIFIGLVDDTGTGLDVKKRLENRGVDTKYIRSLPDGMGTYLAVFDNNGDLAGSISKRPDLSPIGEILKEQGDEIFGRADSIVVELDLERNVLDEVFRLSEKYHKDVYAAVSNISIALERKDLVQKTRCFVINREEAGIFFSNSLPGLYPENYPEFSRKEIEKFLAENLRHIGIREMVVTLGEEGAVFADNSGIRGQIDAEHVKVIDTTGAGDAFFSGVTMGLTYGRTLEAACRIGAHMSASAITTKENVCEPLNPGELDL